MVDRVVLANPVGSALAPNAVWPGLGSKFDDEETAQRLTAIGEALKVLIELILVLDKGGHRASMVELVANKDRELRRLRPSILRDRPRKDLFPPRTDCRATGSGS